MAHLTPRKSIPQLIEELGHMNPKKREQAATGLGQLGIAARGAIHALTITLCEGERVLAWKAAVALRAIGLGDDEAILDLIMAHAEKNQNIRAPAAHALGGLNSEARDMVPRIVKLLSDRRAPVREAACFALSKIGPDATAAIPQLDKLRKDRDFHVRRQAVIALASIGSVEHDSLEEYRSKMDSDENFTREHEAFSSGEVDLRELRSGLRRKLDDIIPTEKADDGKDDEFDEIDDYDEPLTQELPTAAFAAFTSSDAINANSLSHLKDGLRDPKPQVREAAAYALGELGTDAKETAPLLLEALRDSDANVRKAAFFAIHKIIK